MYEEETSDGTGSESETGYSARNKRKRVKSRDADKIRVTWVEAAQIVSFHCNI